MCQVAPVQTKKIHTSAIHFNSYLNVGILRTEVYIREIRKILQIQDEGFRLFFGFRLGQVWRPPLLVGERKGPYLVVLLHGLQVMEDVDGGCLGLCLMTIMINKQTSITEDELIQANLQGQSTGRKGVFGYQASVTEGLIWHSNVNCLAMMWLIKCSAGFAVHELSELPRKPAHSKQLRISNWKANHFKSYGQQGDFTTRPLTPYCSMH